MRYDEVIALGLALPDVEVSTSYGTPALKAKGKLFARLKEDGETLVLKTDIFERELLMRAAPAVFFVTDHYEPYPWVLVRLPKIRASKLAPLLRTAHALTLPPPRKRRTPR